MRMAKLQKATLDPSKISGRCGRLKCCLRYEYETYQTLQKDLPPIGSEIITEKGRARVLAQEILAGELLVETEDMRRVTIDASEVMTVLKRGGGSRKKSRSSGAPPESTATGKRSQKTKSSNAATGEEERGNEPRGGNNDSENAPSGDGDPGRRNNATPNPNQLIEPCSF